MSLRASTFPMVAIGIFAASLAALCLIFATAANASSVKPGNGGKLLPAGYLSTRGSRIVDSKGNCVRIASVGWSGENDLDDAPLDFRYVNYKDTLNDIVRDGFNCIRISWTDGNLHSKNVCAYVDYKINPDLVGMTNMQVLDKMIQYCGTIGLKVIWDHHSDEGKQGSDQQRNGLWYDLGPGTDGTNGAGDIGTVTAQGFQDDSVALAKRYAGNSTVIGFDLDNEPVEGVGRGCNWGQGGPTDILAMFENVGNAIQAVNPGVLIICEGPVNQLVPRTSVFHNTMDLTYVATKPVVLAIPNKVVYSPHEYPNEVSGTKVDSGPAYIDRLNRDWGYIVSQNVAPIWIGEMGAGLGLSTDKDGQDWIAALLPYINGKDGGLGGPTFKNGEQPISTDWWMWGYNGVPDGWGTISQWHPAVFVPATRKVTNQLLFK